MPSLLVHPTRVPQWVRNFERRHPATRLSVRAGALCGQAADGSVFSARLPFSRGYDGPADVDGFLGGVMPPHRWGVLLVRKGGFAVARMETDRLVESKVGQRHVQGRTKAGGSSQQRFARRRDNQARAAYAAAAGHAVRLLGTTRLPVVVGGDRQGVEAVLDDPRLALWRVGEFLAVPDPRRGVLEAAVQDACSVRMTVTNA